MKRILINSMLAAGAGLASMALSMSGASAEARKLPANCSEPKPTLGVALPNTVNPYYIAMQDSFEKNGAANGFNVHVAIANDNDSNQLSQIEAFIQQGVCAVVLNAVNSGPGAASVRALNQAGIPVFTVNVIVSGDDLKAQNASFVEYVGADQIAGGTQIGEQVLKDLGADAKIVAGIIGDPDQIPTNQRDQGFSDVLKKDPNATIVGTLNGKVDPNVSLQVAGDMLQAHPDLNIIWADTGPAAVGALPGDHSAGQGRLGQTLRFLRRRHRADVDLRRLRRAGTGRLCAHRGGEPEKISWRRRCARAGAPAFEDLP